jgi:hypothetical protein
VGIPFVKQKPQGKHRQATHSHLYSHIVLDLNGYIDLWLNTRLVHDLYLKSMEGHLLMIDCEKTSCKIIFCINIFPQVDTLVGVVNCFPLRGI